MPLRVNRDDSPVVVATIDCGTMNALTMVEVGELRTAIEAVPADGALVLTGRPAIFCAGLDTDTLEQGGSAANDLLVAMGGVLEAMLDAPRPIVVAADGHGVAAGAMMMLCADLALVSDRPAKYGFAEVPHGMALPAPVVRLIAERTWPGARLRLAAHGELVGPEEAVRVGLADEIVTVPGLHAHAVERAVDLARLPPGPYAETKRLCNADLLAAFAGVRPI